MRGTLIASAAISAALVFVGCQSKSGSKDCPGGAALKGNAPPEGSVVWCAKSDGTKHGAWKEWYDDGGLKTVGQYADGKMVGHWVTYHPPAGEAEPPAEGEAAKPAAGGEAGAPRKKEEGSYKAGLKVGTWTLYYGDGTTVNRTNEYSDGAKRVRWTAFLEDGTMHARGTLISGKESGLYEEWHPGGQLAEKGQYENGEKVGDWQYWDVDGNPLSEPPDEAGGE